MKRSLVSVLSSLLALSMLGVGCGDGERNDPPGDGDGDTSSGGDTGSGGGEGDGDGDASGGGDGDGDGGAMSCASTQDACGDVCTNTNSDPDHCGECENECENGEGCLQGECKRFGCAPGQVECSDECVDLQRDPQNCGDCGEACDSGSVCSNGTCLTSCPAGQTACNGTCIDPQTDNQYCGATLCSDEAGMGGGGSVDEGTVCSGGQACEAGSCEVICTSERILCGDTCIDPAKDRDFCGATTCQDGATSGEQCAGGEVCVQGSCETSCPSGQIACNGSCIHPDTDNQYCGATLCAEEAGVSGGTPDEGEDCQGGQRCDGGSCVASCSAGRIVCDDECVDPSNDREFCGATDCDDDAARGAICKSGEICSDGACETSCPEGQIVCDDTCVNPDTDEAYCGATACGSDATDGEVCGVSELCISGVCELTCGENLVACDNSCIDPLGDPDYCGATDCSVVSGQGVQCSDNQACVVGECRVYVPQFTAGERVDTPVNAVFQDPSVATDPAGNAIAVWRQATVGNDFASNRLFASSFDRSTKMWSPQVEITEADVSVRNVKVAMSSTGDAIAVWVEGGVGTISAPIANRLLASLYDRSSKSWSTPVHIDSSTNAIIDTPFVVIDGAGDALVVWAQGDASVVNTTQIFQSVYSTTNETFSTPTAFPRGSVLAGNASTYYPRAAINDAGQAAVVWQEYTSGGVDSVLTPVPVVSVGSIAGGSSSWGAPVDMKGGQVISGVSRSHDVGIDATGAVTVVYSAYDGFYNQAVYKRRHTGSWGGAHVTDLTGTPGAWLSEGDPQAHLARIAVLPSGDAWVALTVQGYSDFDPYYIPPYSIQALSFTSGVWSSSPVKLSGDSIPAEQRPEPVIASDASGNVFVSWVRHSSTQAFAETIRYSASLGLWDASPTQLNTTTLIAGAFAPNLAVADGGNAFVGWVQQASGATHLFVGRFD